MGRGGTKETKKYSSIHQRQILLVGVVKNEIPSVGNGLLYSELHHIYIYPTQ
jgi:hypothetical protein